MIWGELALIFLAAVSGLLDSVSDYKNNHSIRCSCGFAPHQRHGELLTPKPGLFRTIP